VQFILRYKFKNYVTKVTAFSDVPEKVWWTHSKPKQEGNIGVKGDNNIWGVVVLLGLLIAKTLHKNLQGDIYLKVSWQEIRSILSNWHCTTLYILVFLRELYLYFVYTSLEILTVNSFSALFSWTASCVRLSLICIFLN
jgi:hypothetical protein